MVAIIRLVHTHLLSQHKIRQYSMQQIKGRRKIANGKTRITTNTTIIINVGLLQSDLKKSDVAIWILFLQ